MSKDELAAWEVALKHVRQARASVARLHDRLVRDRVVQQREAWGPLNSLDFAVSSLETSRRKRGRMMPTRPPRPRRPPRSGWRPDVQGGLCNGK